VKPLADVEHSEQRAEQYRSPSHFKLAALRPAFAASTAPSMVRLLVSRTKVITMPLMILGENGKVHSN